LEITCRNSDVAGHQTDRVKYMLTDQGDHGSKGRMHLLVNSIGYPLVTYKTIK